jgi:hypothetical protein
LSVRRDKQVPALASDQVADERLLQAAAYLSPSGKRVPGSENIGKLHVVFMKPLDRTCCITRDERFRLERSRGRSCRSAMSEPC